MQKGVVRPPFLLTKEQIYVSTKRQQRKREALLQQQNLEDEEDQPRSPSDARRVPPVNYNLVELAKNTINRIVRELRRLYYRAKEGKQLASYRG